MMTKSTRVAIINATRCLQRCLALRYTVEASHAYGWITSFTDRSNLLDELESAFKRDVVESTVTTFPMHTINVEIKYKLSDFEIALNLNNAPNQLPVTGYIQSERQKTID